MDYWKIIELLNDYIPEWWSIEHWGNSIFYEWVNYNDRIIWKNFWFIKRLVENDKIDLDIAREKLGIPCCVWYGNWRIIAVKDVEDYGQILMLLAISDNPIQDLIDLLC